MAAPALSPRDAYVHRASRFCRSEFDGTPRYIPCARALTEATNADQATMNLLCATLAASPVETAECSEISKGLTFEQASGVDAPLRKRFGFDNVKGARFTIGRAREVLEAFVPPEGRIIAPSFPPSAPAAPPTQALPPPQAPTPTLRDVVAEIRTGLVGPPLTPLEVTTFVKAVQECARHATIPTLQDFLARTAANIESVHGGDERSKLDELCHQIADFRKVVPQVAPEWENAVRAVETCLCPRGSSHVSLLQLLGGG
ncbi:MAG: hypothetical protein WC985_11295 [Thermoplasmata archaeon]